MSVLLKKFIMRRMDSHFKYRWYAKGDVNAFFGLMLDNMTGLVVLASILMGIFKMPAEIVLLKMVPGTALGVMLGDLAYTWMAFRLAEKEKRHDVCAMPLGIDAIALFGLTLGVIGPVFAITKDADLAWAVGMAVLVVMGAVKTITAFSGEAIRRAVPRAALLGSIGAVAIVLIAFMPFMKIIADPIGGFVAFGVILLTFFARVRMPGGVPGVLAAVGLGTIFFYISKALGFSHGIEIPAVELQLSLPWPTLTWLNGLAMGVKYLPIAVPIAIVNVIGGIDNTESAAVAGDNYSTRDILLVEGIATLIAGLCGGVVQNTPYIGHPAYKRMGGRAAYTLATALFIGICGMTGIIGLLITVLPESVLVPILVFIGLEVCSQAYRETDQRHLAAVSICFIPVMANLLFIQFNSLIGSSGLKLETLSADFQNTYQAVMILGNGFICTAMFWATMLVELIDRHLKKAAYVAWGSAFATMMGLIHSPFPDGRLFLPGAGLPTPVYTITIGYLLMGATFFIISCLQTETVKE